MIKNIPAETTLLSNQQDVVFVENDLNVLMIYRMDGTDPTLKLTNIKDILAVRDMLNRAYPVNQNGQV